MYWVPSPMPTPHPSAAAAAARGGGETTRPCDSAPGKRPSAAAATLARRKLAVHVVARQHAGELAAAPGGAAELVPDLDALKQRLGFFPAVVEVAQR